MLTFSKSQVDNFQHTNKWLRYGQEFYQYFELHKCHQDKAFCDKLYNAPDDVAKMMIATRIDNAQ